MVVSGRGSRPTGNPLFDQVVAILDLDQAELTPTAGIYGMRYNALILMAWYSWFAVLLGALVYFLFG